MYPKFKINVYFIFLNIGDLTFGITLVQKQWLDKGQLPVPVAESAAKERSSSASGGTMKVLFIMNLCHMAVRSTQSIFSTIRENVYSFARKVPSASEPKARYFRRITLIHT
jgi:hypothetical protein